MEEWIVKEISANSSSYSEITERIAALRYEVWRVVDSSVSTLFPSKKWWDGKLDDEGRHWVVYSIASNELIASARLTLHLNATDGYRDVRLFEAKGVSLSYPVCDLGRMVVHKDFRRKGIAKILIEKRIKAAKGWGAKAILCTATETSVEMLVKQFHFCDIHTTAIFEDRPNTIFHALYLILD
jgi:GNAT superfamily N-acetyltransferase